MPAQCPSQWNCFEMNGCLRVGTKCLAIFSDISATESDADKTAFICIRQMLDNRKKEMNLDESNSAQRQIEIFY